ncbi:MAG: DUF1499 domain-containing protein [Desulfobacterales bacterium]
MRIFFCLLLTVVLLSACAGKRPANLGVHNGLLADCPGTPNCVNSQATDESHSIASLSYSGDKKDAFLRLKKIIESEKRTRIITESEAYLHVEFTSMIMGFVDDVEFYFPDEPLIHVRSASRLGSSDLGVNRKRVERLRELFSGKSG